MKRLQTRKKKRLSDGNAWTFFVFSSQSAPLFGVPFNCLRQEMSVSWDLGRNLQTISLSAVLLFWSHYSCFEFIRKVKPETVSADFAFFFKFSGFHLLLLLASIFQMQNLLMLFSFFFFSFFFSFCHTSCIFSLFRMKVYLDVSVSFYYQKV